MVVLRTTSIAAGGDAVARDADGRVVFVRGALPGEEVAVELTESKARFAKGQVVDVLDPSPDRVAPPCPHLARGCGGCSWQHVAPEAQRELKRQIVVDTLTRIGGLTDPVVDLAPALPTAGYRTTLRLAVHEGRGGFRQHRAHDVVDVDDCLVAHPLLADLLATSSFGDATEVTLRCGARTGERLVHADAPVQVPPDVRFDEYHEEVAGVRFRISARSFFQARPDGAEALVEAVRTAIADAPDGPLVDAYGGVGLFAATVAGDRPVTLLEQSASSVEDARHNLPHAKVLKLDVARWRPEPAAVVVADPSREGLSAGGVSALNGAGSARLVLISCDPASLGRDASLLTAQGFTHDGTTLVDLFPHTPHVEAVTRFIRDPGRLRRGLR